MIEHKDLDSCNSAQLLERAYTLKSPRQALALYHDWASTYDKHLEEGLQYIGPAEIAGLLAEALADRTALVLDVGCGTGLVGEYLVAHGFSAIDGLDFSPQMLAVAAQKALYRELIQANLNGDLDLPDQIYDAAISCGTFTHGHVGAGALDEILRLLKPGGVFACTIHRDIWHEAGFATRISQLSAGGTIALDRILERPFFRGQVAAARCCLLRKL